MRDAYWLKCINCDDVFPIIPMYKCPTCNGIVVVQYNYNVLNKEKIYSCNMLKSNLIYHNYSENTLINEENTPIIYLNNLARQSNLKELSAKCEFSNFTGSFKDRPVSAGIKKAIKFGFNKVIVASSGNGASSVSAFAAKNNIKSIVLVPENTPKEKLKQSNFYGGETFKVKGPYSNSFNLALEASKRLSLFNLTTTFINPYTLEGNKGVAYEIYFQLKKWPEYIIVPIGAGPLLVGIYKGFWELKKIYNLKIEIPKLIGVQAKGNAPIALAFEYGYDNVISERNPKTIAGGIADGLLGYTEDGTYTLNIIKKTQGFCLTVSDNEIIEAQENLAREEGIFVEPSAAASIAVLNNPLCKRHLNQKSVLSMLTGHGLKDMDSLSKQNNIYTINPDLKELEKKL